MKLNAEVVVDGISNIDWVKIKIYFDQTTTAIFSTTIKIPWIWIDYILLYNSLKLIKIFDWTMDIIFSITNFYILKIILQL